jgi:hypothetical protein
MQQATFIALSDAKWADLLVVSYHRKGVPDIHWTGCWVSFLDNISAESLLIHHSYSFQ